MDTDYTEKFSETLTFLSEMTELFSVDTGGIAYSNCKNMVLQHNNNAIPIEGPFLDMATITQAELIFKRCSGIFSSIGMAALRKFNRFGKDEAWTSLMLDQVRPLMASTARGMQLLAAGTAEAHDEIKPGCNCETFDNWMRFWEKDRTEQIEVWDGIEQFIAESSA